MKKIFLSVLIAASALQMSAAAEMIRNDFDKSSEGWNTPKYWNGSLSRRNGKMELVPTFRNGKTFGRCTKMILPMRHLSGALLDLEFSASGKGSVTIGTMLFPAAGRKPYMVEHTAVKLTAQEKKYNVRLNFEKLQTDRISLTFEVGADSKFVFDDLKLKRVIDEKIIIYPPDIPVMRGKCTDIKIRTNAPGRKFSVFSGPQYFSAVADKNGTVICPADKIVLNKKDNSSDITAACGGRSLRFQTSVVPAAEFDRNIAAAAKVGKSPLQILWLGDSELDFDRSRNTPAQVNFYLNKVKANSSSFFNFAVAGDSLSRVDARLAGRYTYRREAYDDLKKADPDLIIIMLGHNDSMTRSGDGFKTSQVPLEKQQSLSRNILRTLRSRFPSARVLLVSPLALDGKFLRAQTDKRIASGVKNAFWFGSPVMMKKFTENWKAAAAAAEVEFLDIYTPMSKISDRIKFFKPGDEVHLNASGHIWLTARIMEYLAANPNWDKVKKYTAQETFTFRAPELASGGFSRGSASIGVSGKWQINSRKALEMDGATAEIALSGTAVPDVSKGFTVDLVCKGGKPAGNRPIDLAYDGLFYAPGSLVLARYQRSFYLQCFDGKKYQRAFLSPAFFDLKNPRAHHIAMTARYHKAVDQGEMWTEIQIYVDGKAVLSRKLPDIELQAPGGNWEFAGSSKFGKPWNFGGEIFGGGFFNRILTEKEIRDRVLEFKDVVTPAFEQAAHLPDEVTKKIRTSALPEYQKSACINLAKSGFSALDEILADPQKYLISCGKNNVLTILNYTDKNQVISLYDQTNSRELLAWNNPFFELHFIRGSEKVSIPMSRMKNSFVSAPVTENGVTVFSVAHTRKEFPAASGVSKWRFNGSRLEYSLDVRSDSYMTVLERVTLPSVVVAPLDEKDTALVVPEAGGLLYKGAVAGKVTYKGIYPRMLTSMQCGAVYDKKGGVYFSPADPLGRMMNYYYRIDSDGLEVKIDRPVARESFKKKNSFSSESSAVIEPFKGDWYDAGLLYRQELDRINALWWRKTLPNTDTPEWFRKNALNLLVFHIPDPDVAIKLRNYLGCGYTIQHWYWWERGAGHHLCPIPRANTEYIAYAKLMKQHDIRVISYTNGRLWSTRDKRGEATLFKTDGTAAAVKKADGSVQMEPYGAPCAVLCPASDIYQKAMYDMLTRLVGQGVSGCFIDQLGAARPILCQIAAHGHLANDAKSWNVNGHRKAFLPIREYWRKNNIDAITSTEDNSEHCVGLVDALSPWRWMHDNQIPLHALVYSGRTQYISRDPVGADLDAPFAKTAVQIVQGEQMGTFGSVELTSPAKGIFRRYLKRLVNLRFAALDFFNCGMMLRPPQITGTGKKISTRWGNHGTKYVSTLPVIAGAWELDGRKLIILINTTAKRRSGRIADEFEQRLEVFKSNGGSASDSTFDIEPYGCELRLYGKPFAPEKLENIRRAFAVIRKSFTEADPFGVDKMKFTDTQVFNAAAWQQAAAAPLVLGARVNKDVMVLDNVFYCVFFAGTGDFGTPSRGYFEVEISAPSYSGGGNIQIFTGHPDSGTMVATMVLDRKKVLTKSWSDYRKYRIPANQVLGGKHKIFFKLNGGSACNFRNWRWVPGGVK